jgi:autotransporter translocation and assembly factor TamB
MISSMSLLLQLGLMVSTVTAGLVPRASIQLTTPPLDVPDSIQRTWGTTTPFFPVADYPAVPEGCSIDQVSRAHHLLAVCHVLNLPLRST